MRAVAEGPGVRPLPRAGVLVEARAGLVITTVRERCELPLRRDCAIATDILRQNSGALHPSEADRALSRRAYGLDRARRPRRKGVEGDPGDGPTDSRLQGRHHRGRDT